MPSSEYRKKRNREQLARLNLDINQLLKESEKIMHLDTDAALELLRTAEEITRDILWHRS